MGIDPEGVFRSGQLRICSLCLGDIDPDDQCTYVEDEISCMDCFTAAHTATELDEEQVGEAAEWEYEGGALEDDFSYGYDYDY